MISYEVPIPSEIRSLDLLRSIVLLPQIHQPIMRIVAQASGTSEILVQEVRDVVASGELLISDGVVSYQREHGLAMPLMFPNPKAGQGVVSREPKAAEGGGDEKTRVCNRMQAEKPEHKVHRPLRSRRVFPIVGAKDVPVPIRR